MQHLHIADAPKENTPLLPNGDDDDNNDNEDSDDDHDHDGSNYFGAMSGKMVRRQSIAADRLSERLLSIRDDDDELEDKILHEHLHVDMNTPLITMSERDRPFRSRSSVVMPGGHDQRQRQRERADAAAAAAESWKNVGGRFLSMTGLCVLAFGLVIAAFSVGAKFVGPPNQPVGPYELIERQEGEDFFGYYTFYEGPDSVGSNGYISYVNEERAKSIAIAKISHEVDELDTLGRRRLTNEDEESSDSNTKKPFLYLQTAATDAGPRESVRLEGKKRFNRGLFVIDVRHMPAGCGMWPAFWLTDEANWPVNGEIDIVEGVNFQSEAKTALHTSKRCNMYDVPEGSMTGTWDTAVGIPDKKTGIPDTTVREARNCYVYDPHQWLNQGCVAIDAGGGSLGGPLNQKGGGIFALEWDPIYRHIRTWVFSPHTSVPDNLVDAIRTASETDEAKRVVPNPEEWPLPYGNFPIGDSTNCAGTKFRNMRLVLNTALCGSVAGNRFFMDCKNESKTYKTCNEYIKSRPDALKEAYWKIRGVYVYQRQWQKAWLHY
mmetsp:Transcript_20569/g.57075  ORF Transcript_20569/g.57075 Transcript_20569/m.57075 type:complete len:547 (-) Transcript_20569:237-1877(-)